MTSETEAVPKPEPIIFGRNESTQLFGWYHAPRVVRGPAVVLCPPLGFEHTFSYRAYRHLAEALATAGMPALRFDYRGTGDSPGRDRDPGCVRGWIDSVKLAVVEARRQSGVSRVALYGVRMGGTLALASAIELGDIDAVVTWGALSGGRAYVRELRAFRMLYAASSTPSSGIEEGEEEAGYLLTKETVADLGALNLMTMKGRVAQRVLLLSRDDLPDDGRLAKQLAAGGADVVTRTAAGYVAMMAQPNPAPAGLEDDVVGWLGETRAPVAPTPAPSAPARKTFTAASERAEAPDVVEEPMFFGGDERLFGIVTRPHAPRGVRHRTAVVLPNCGVNHHAGPNRIYTRLARDLASRGFTVLRLDVAGIGDSPVRNGKEENELYAAASLEDVRAAISTLRAKSGIDRYVVGGICSGAYIALHVAATDPGVVGQFLINAQTFTWREGDSLELAIKRSTRSFGAYLGAAAQKDTWRRLFRGEVHVMAVATGLGRKLGERVVRRLNSKLRPLGLANDAEFDVAGAFRGIVDRGADTLFVFSDADGGIDTMESHLGRGGRMFKGRPNFGIEYVKGADHTFTGVATQERLIEIVAGHVERRFG